MTVKGQLLKSASVIALVTVISRICGYLRDQRVALLLGTSPAADSLVLAFRNPQPDSPDERERARSGRAFIPVFTGYLRERPSGEAWGLAQKVFWDMAVLLGTLAALGVIFSRQVVHLFTLLSHNPAQWDLAVYLNRIVIPAMFFLGAGGDCGGDAAQLSVFALPATTSIVFNLVMILFSFAVVYQPVMRLAPERFQTPAVAIACSFLLGANHPVRDADSGAGAAGDEVSAGCVVERSGRAESGLADGPGGFRHGSLSDQFFCRQDFFDVLADAAGKHHVALRGGAGDATGAGSLRDGDVDRDFAYDVASGGGGRVRTR